MTVRVTTLTGSDAGLYYVEHLPSYYLDGGEPPGRWRGRGADALGLSGGVDDGAFVALMAGHHPGTGEPLGRRYGEKSVRGFDVTASGPKGVSILFATGDADVRRHAVEAHDTAVDAMADWIEAHAHTRYRIDGEVAVVDAEGIISASFRQHTSRALDPQIHTHLVIPNRVRSPDGRWLALDARTIKLDQRTLSALYHATLRSELRRRLGVRWLEPINGIAEIADIPEDLRTLFSSRTEAMLERLDEKLERFSDTFGREPTHRERWKLEREAATDSRPPKEHFADAAALHATWVQQLEAAGWERERLLDQAVTRDPPARALDPPTRERMIAHALDALTEKQSTWRPAELVRELAAAVPTDVTTTAEELVPALDLIADEVVAERLIDLSRPVPEGAQLRRDGRPVSESVIHRALTTSEILAEEERLVAWAERCLDAELPDRRAAGAEELDGPQRELATAVAGDRQLVLAVGPAGTGKTAALRPAAEQLRADGRPVFGLTPSATAAEVLAVDTGVEADTLDKLLHEHRLDRPPDHRYDLPSGSTVIVDEAAMVSTPRLAELADLAERRGWRLALVGDPLQFSAVGRSGMFGYLVDTYGAIELGHVHRFVHDWEREASLRLRRGDVTVIDEYEQHGRLHGGNRRRTQRSVIDAWWDAISWGESASMMAPTTESVATLNRLAQQRRIEAGEIDPTGASVAAGECRAHAGDLVSTRRNNRRLLTDRGLMVKNRDRWTIRAVHRDGSLTVEGSTGRVRLPADYVDRHVELAYAETSHANQGRTVDRSFLFLDGATDTRGIYVPMTRGRHSNEAFVVLGDEESAADVVTEALTRDWIDVPAVQRREELEWPIPTGDGRGLPLPRLELRHLLFRERELGQEIHRVENRVAAAIRRLQENEQRRRQLADSLAQAQWRYERALRKLEQLDRPLRRRGNRAEIDRLKRQVVDEPRRIARDERDLGELRAEHPVLQDELMQARRAFEEQPELAAERDAIRERLDEDARARGRTLLDRPFSSVIDAIGPRPTGTSAALLWEDTAGRLLHHSIAFGVPARTLLENQPRSIDYSAEAASHRAAVEAMERLDRALGRQLTVEPPQRDLGLSL